MANFQIAALFQQVFGVAFTPPTAPPLAAFEELAGINRFDVYAEENTAERDAPITWMGTPWMFPITFAGGVYKQYANDGSIEQSRVGKLILPPATIADFSQSKALVETELPGAYGEVTEQYGFRPWEIRIRGLALNERGSAGLRAIDYKRLLMGFNRLIEPVEVEGSEFSEKDITHIIIKDILFRRLEGRPNVIPFEIVAKSETALELQYI